jgi:hypothetical protein
MVKEDDGREGIVAVIIPSFQDAPIPLVTASRTTANEFAAYARLHADASGRPVRLVRFAEAETLEKL